MTLLFPILIGLSAAFFVCSLYSFYYNNRYGLPNNLEHLDSVLMCCAFYTLIFSLLFI